MSSLSTLLYSFSLCPLSFPSSLPHPSLYLYVCTGTHVWMRAHVCTCVYESQRTTLGIILQVSYIIFYLWNKVFHLRWTCRVIYIVWLWALAIHLSLPPCLSFLFDFQRLNSHLRACKANAVLTELALYLLFIWVNLLLSMLFPKFLNSSFPDCCLFVVSCTTLGFLFPFSLLFYQESCFLSLGSSVSAFWIRGLSVCATRFRFLWF